MADEKRYEETHSPEDIANYESHTVEDKVTGNKGKGISKKSGAAAKDESERKAWEDLRGKQGPPRSRG